MLVCGELLLVQILERGLRDFGASLELSLVRVERLVVGRLRALLPRLVLGRATLEFLVGHLAVILWPRDVVQSAAVPEWRILAQ